MKQQKRQRRKTARKQKKLNNQGFSLIEVLIAVIILVIVSIPLIRSFATTATTNARAKVLLRATDCAENMMEAMEYRSLEELAKRYGISDKNSVTVNDDGSYDFVIKDVTDMPISLPEGYYITMKADPGLYPNANALNLADVRSMTIPDTAVYNMPSLYDESIYKTFEQWNYEAHEDQSLLYQEAPADYFKKNLKRTIEVTIDKKGSDTDADGNMVDLVNVTMRIRYYFDAASNYKNYLPVSQKEYVVGEKELYNNIATKVALENIYIFFQPRYLATAGGNKDEIIVYNEGNVKTNVFVCAQTGVPDLAYKTKYYNAITGPKVTIVENPEETITAETMGAATLFTNMSEKAPYSSLPGETGVVQNGNILCELIYQNPAGTQKATGMDAVKVLDGRDLDGKVLIGSNTKNRIYKVYVTIMAPDGLDEDSDADVFLELDGTKLE